MPVQKMLDLHVKLKSLEEQTVRTVLRNPKATEQDIIAARNEFDAMKRAYYARFDTLLDEMLKQRAQDST